MAFRVKDAYRVKYFLDTNILVDLVEGKYPNLVQALTFMADCDYVDLHSSMYVMYEFAEVRKYNLFKAELNTKQPGLGDKYSKAVVKSSWIVDGEDYADSKGKIEAQVVGEIKQLENVYGIDFHRHILHNDLVAPAMALFLTTHISKEDSLVLLSCVKPDEQKTFSNMKVVSHDNEFSHSASHDSQTINKLFSKEQLDVPEIINTHSWVSAGQGYSFDLYADINSDNVEDTLRKKISEHIKSQNDFLGITKNIGNKGVCAKCICFLSSRKDVVEWNDETTLIIIPKTLDRPIYGIPSNLSFWKNNTESPDRLISESDSVSIIDNDIDKELLALLKENGNLVLVEKE